MGVLTRRTLSAAAVISGVALTSAPEAYAAFFQNGTGLSEPTFTITFDEILLPNRTPVTNQYESFGLSFSPTVYYAEGINGVTNFLDGEGPFFAVDVIFADPVIEAAVQVITSRPTLTAEATFTAYLGGSQVESGIGRLGTGNYFGFSGVSFDRISIDPYDSADLGLRFPILLDNIQRPAEVIDNPQVPAPLPLLGVGAAFGYSRKLRKRIKSRKLPEVMSAID